MKQECITLSTYRDIAKERESMLENENNFRAMVARGRKCESYLSEMLSNKLHDIKWRKVKRCSSQYVGYLKNAVMIETKVLRGFDLQMTEK